MEVLSPKLIVSKEGELKRWNEVEEGGCQQNLPREGALVLNRIPHCQSSAENIDAIEMGMCHHVPSGIWIWSRLKVLFSPEEKYKELVDLRFQTYKNLPVFSRQNQSCRNRTENPT